MLCIVIIVEIRYRMEARYVISADRNRERGMEPPTSRADFP